MGLETGNRMMIFQQLASQLPDTDARSGSFY